MAEGILRTERIISYLGGISEGFVRLLRRFVRILTFSPFDESISYKKVLTLSIEKGAISSAYGSRLLSKIRTRVIRTFHYEGDRFPSPEELASVVSILLGEIKKRPHIELVIPKPWVVFRIVEFPITVKENLHNVVFYEMDRITPFNPEDVFFDYRLIKEDGERLSILLVAAKRDTVSPYINALQDIGLQVRRITIGLFAISNLSYYSGKGGYTIFLDVDRDCFESSLFQGPLPLDYLSENLETGDVKLKVERVVKTLQPFFERVKLSGTTPEVLLLLRDSGLKEILKANINYPLRLLGETDLKIKLPQTKDVSYVAIGGLIESLSKGEKIDLLSLGRRQREKTPILLTLILSVTIILLFFAYLITPLRIEQKRLHLIDEQIAHKKAEVKKVELLKKEVEDLRNEVVSINNFKEFRTSSLGILKEITQTLPKNAWLTRFRVTDTTVDIEGYASSATELLPKLEASRFFRKVEFSSPTFRDARMNADRFIIKMEIETTKSEVKVDKK